MQKKSQNEKKSYEISLSLFLLFLFFTIISKAQDVEHINLKKPVTFHGNLNFQLDYTVPMVFLQGKKNFLGLSMAILF